MQPNDHTIGIMSLTQHTAAFHDHEQSFTKVSYTDYHPAST